MRKPLPIVVSTDNDHTMVGFCDGAVPGWRDALPLIAEATGLSIAEVGCRIGTVFAIEKTHDFPWALPLAFATNWQGSIAEFVEKIEEPFWALQDHYREKYVKPYPGVIETLKELKRRGVLVFCVSDAPYFMALARLVDSGISEYIQGAYALDVTRPSASAVPSEEWLRYGDERIVRLENKYANHGLKFARKNPPDFSKPDPRAIQMAMSDFGITDPSLVIHVGDSVEKDIGLVSTAGLGGGLYTPWHAMGNLPAEYVEWLTEVMKADPKKCPEAVTKITHPMPEHHGQFSDILSMLGRGAVEEMPDSYQA